MCVFLHTIRTCVQEIWCTNDIERPIRGQPSHQSAGAWRAHAHCPYWAYHPYLAHQAYWAYCPYHPYLAHQAYWAYCPYHPYLAHQAYPAYWA